MMRYCRAYHLSDLRRFAGWQEPAESELTAGTVVYLCDDLTVVANPVRPDEGALWDNPTPDWERFCLTELDFTIPEYLTHD